MYPFLKSKLPYFLGLFIALSCQPKVQNEEEIEQLPVITLTTQTVELKRNYVADIQAVKNVEIRNRVSGFLEAIYVDEGKEVKKDQPLFKINDLEYRAELASSNANLKSAIAEAKAAELELERVQAMVDKKVISKVELNMAKAKLSAANARIEEAKSLQKRAEIRLSHTVIKAPFTGVIDRIPLKIGSLLQEGTLITTISEVNNVYAYFHVSENEYLQYTRNKAKDKELKYSVVKLILADGSNYPQDGRVETIEGEFESSTGAIAFRAIFPNPDRLLKHGATGKIIITTKEQDALLVPQKAVFEIQDKNYVFTVDENNVVHVKSFSSKSRVSQFYVVSNGLKAGDKVVYEGIQELKDGEKIIPKMITMDSLNYSLTAN
jgi:membrane fusion protein (multidrug efflux system)